MAIATPIGTVVHVLGRDYVAVTTDGKNCNGCAGKGGSLCVHLPACTFQEDTEAPKFIVWKLKEVVTDGS